MEPQRTERDLQREMRQRRQNFTNEIPSKLLEDLRRIEKTTTGKIPTID